MFTVDLNSVKLVVKAVCGYDIPDTDEGLIAFISKAKIDEFLRDTNLLDVPDGASSYLVNRVAGEYLRLNDAKVLLGDDISVAKSIREGDTSIEFTGETPADRLAQAIDHLTRKRDVICWRKLKW